MDLAVFIKLALTCSSGPVCIDEDGCDVIRAKIRENLSAVKFEGYSKEQGYLKIRDAVVQACSNDLTFFIKTDVYYCLDQVPPDAPENSMRKSFLGKCLRLM